MITSPSNPRVKELRQLLKNAAETDTFAVEGLRGAEEALRSGANIVAAFTTEKFRSTERGGQLLQELEEAGLEVLTLAETVMDRVSATRSPQGIVLEVKKQWSELRTLTSAGRPLFILDGVSDPGNLGTIIRIADAFALGGIVLGEGCVSPHNDKAVRSAMGSVFRVPFCRSPIDDAVAVIEDADFEIYATDVSAGLNISTAKLPQQTAVVLGSEAHGIRNIDTSTLGRLHIETPGKAESLNVSVAAGIIAYAMTKA